MRMIAGWLASALALPVQAAGEGGSGGWLLAGLLLPLGLYLALQLLGACLPQAPLLAPQRLLLCRAVSLAGAGLSGWHGGLQLQALLHQAFGMSELPAVQMVATASGLLGGLLLAALVYSLGMWLLQGLLRR